MMIQLANQPFAKGGEAELYQIMNNPRYPNHVAKIYHPSKRTDQREYKIMYLMRHTPNLGSKLDMAWPQDILYDTDGEFLGLILPRVRGEKLETLCLPKLPRHLANQQAWQQFDRSHPNAITCRLQVCVNIAGIVAQLHSVGCYTIIDLKPDNILVRADGTVSIIDTDSIEITEDNIELFAAKVLTPEYTPPEFYRGVNPQNTIVEPSWDSFALAVIVYRMLLGIHPFAATSSQPFHHLNTLAQKIEHGLFVHAPAKPIRFRHIPQPHQFFEQLPTQL
ncbi:MAG: serine/threonine protein kinase, partial [Saprospiraceae bacterium]|nr:serine/threonine protein kinase [Saprospiraceae bacterium]